MPSSSSPARGPLDGVRVLELGNFIAAPTTGRVLAEFGAEVVKVEQPGVGDPIRRWRLFSGSTSMLWRTMSRNKKSLTLDLRTAAGQEIVRALAREADIVVENFRPGQLEGWGIGPLELRAENSELILVRISGYGQTGPYSDRPGFGGVAEAIGGIRYITGHPDRPPTRVGVSLGDTLAGLHGVIGALLGLLRRRERPGDPGETVDVALYEAVFAVMESTVAEYTAHGVIRERAGNALPGIAPSNTYPCSDGEWVVIAANTDAMFRALMSAIGRPELAADPELADNSRRAERSGWLDELVADWTSRRERDAVIAELGARGIVAGPIYSAADIVADEHYQARGMLLESEILIDGAPRAVSFPGIVPKLEHEPGEMRWAGPELGEHTGPVLHDWLGMSEDEIDRLRAKGIV